jgi:hypothetical protein
MVDRPPSLIPMLGNSRSRSWRTRVPVAILAATSLVVAAGCDKLNPTPEAPPVINDYVSAIQVLGEGGTSEVINQQLGEGAADGPAADVSSDATVINGGSVQESITSETKFSKVRMALEPVGATPTGTGTATAAPATPGSPSKGYHEITLEQAANEIEIVVTIAQALPGTTFVFYFAVVDEGGKQGKLSKQDVEALEVGTGDVQISVSWDADSDVDLHVVDPSDDEIYWDTPSSPSGGELDLDSNADCDLDHKRNENITWTDAPPGEYIVRLDYYKACDIAKTNYVVTIRVSGQATRTYTGSFSGEGDEGGLGDGKQIATFTVT